MQTPQILIAEDEVDVREFLVRAVRRLMPESQVTAVENGWEALSLAQQYYFDIILTDQRMPVMDGITLLRYIRDMGLATPVIFITAEILSEDLSAYGGANAIYYKPISIDEIREILHTWLV